MKSSARSIVPAFVKSSFLLSILLCSVLVNAQDFLTPGLTPQQVQARIDNDDSLLIIDIRQPPEFRAGHIPGAINIPITKLKRRIDELIDQHGDVLIYCINGKRTRQAEPILLDQGVDNLYHLEGAFFGWMKSGLKVEKGWVKQPDKIR